MGMFDTIRSSYDLGKEFDTELQTKDIEDGICGTMSNYWISPSGQLYLIDYAHTADMKIYEPGDPEYNEERAWLNFEWIPNGNHGKVKPWYLTKYVRVYPAQYDGQWENWPERLLHFRYGVIIDVYDSKDLCPTTPP